MPAQQPEQIHALFVEAFNAGDLEALVALYEPEGMLATRPGGSVRGSEAIREAYRTSLAMCRSIAVETRNVFRSGDLALMHGRWSIEGTGPDGAAVRREGRNTEVARRQPDGGWLLVIDNPFTPE